MTSLSSLDQLENHFAEIVRQMDADVFDSHAFILKLAKAYQRLYVEALSATDGYDPFRQVHGQIANRLAKHTDLVTALGKVTSPNIFGDPSSNEQWERHS